MKKLGFIFNKLTAANVFLIAFFAIAAWLNGTIVVKIKLLAPQANELSLGLPLQFGLSVGTFIGVTSLLIAAMLFCVRPQVNTLFEQGKLYFWYIITLAVVALTLNSYAYSLKTIPENTQAIAGFASIGTLIFMFVILDMGISAIKTALQKNTGDELCLRDFLNPLTAGFVISMLVVVGSLSIRGWLSTVREFTLAPANTSFNMPATLVYTMLGLVVLSVLGIFSLLKLFCNQKLNKRQTIFGIQTSAAWVLASLFIITAVTCPTIPDAAERIFVSGMLGFAFSLCAIVGMLVFLTADKR